MRPVQTKESGMYGRVVMYTYDEDKGELEAKARAGVIPIVTNTPGYISYGVMFLDDLVVSTSAWDSEEHAKAADAALAEWVNSQTTMKVQKRVTGDFSWLELAHR
jgi:heme-degrading monooxygenase HmoA